MAETGRVARAFLSVVLVVGLLVPAAPAGASEESLSADAQGLADAVAEGNADDVGQGVEPVEPDAPVPDEPESPSSDDLAAPDDETPADDAPSEEADGQPEDFAPSQDAQDGQGEPAQGGEPAFQESAGDQGGNADAATADAAVENGAVFNLAAVWENAGVIDQAGTYRLADDASFNRPLVVKLGKGEHATIDLAGHAVTVKLSGKDAAAIDFGANEGSIAIVDSTFKPLALPAEVSAAKQARASIVLSLEDARGTASVAKVVATEGALASEPSVSFEHVRLGVEETFGSGESISSSVEVVSTGLADEAAAGRDEEAEIVSVTLTDCAIEVRQANALTATAIQEGLAAGSSFGATRAVRARSKGVELRGSLHVAGTFEGFEGIEGHSPAVTVAGRFERTFAIDAAIELDSPVLLEAPEEGEGDRLVVAETIDGERLDDDAFASLEPVGAYVLELGSEGSEVELVRTPESAGNGAAEAGGVQGAGADALSSGMRYESLVILDDERTSLLAADALVLRAQSALGVQSVDIDLNADWQSRAGGYSGVYNITSGGVYSLSDSITAANGIVVNAPGQDVTIRFNGHTLSATGTGDATTRTVLKVTAASSVTLDGSSSGGASTLSSRGKGDVRVVSLEASGCALAMNDLNVKLVPESTQLLALGTHDVYARRGSVEMSRCNLVMDYGNQTVSSSSQLKAAEAPSAVYAASGVSSVRLVGCTVSATGTPSVAPPSAGDLDAAGNVYALYSAASSTRVEGGSYSATAALGNATCLYGKKGLDVSAAPSLRVSAGGIGTGILSTAASSAVVAAPISFASSAQYGNDASGSASALLHSTVENGFVLSAAGAPASDAQGSYTALVMPSSLAAANGDGMRIGALSPGASAQQASAWQAALSNAFGPGAGCAVASDSNGLYFKLVSDRAVAQIGSARYATIDAALDALADGQTLVLLADVGDVSVVKARSAEINLNGHSVNSLSFATPSSGSGAGGLVVRNGSVVGSRVVSSARVGVYHASALPLRLEGVSVGLSECNANTYAVQAAPAASGALTLQGCDVAVTASRTGSSASAYGVYIDRSSSATLSLVNSDVMVTTPSANVGVTGVYSPVSASVRGGSVTARSVNGSAGAVRAGGVLSVQGARLRVETTEAAAGVYGIAASDAEPSAADVTVDSCQVEVTSLGSGAVDYWCLRGGTIESSMPGTAWTLKGACSFKSSSASHMGLNVSQVELASDFALDAASDAPLRVSQQRIAGDVGFLAAPGADTPSNAQAFAAYPGSAYDGWALIAESGQLRWISGTADGAVQLVRSGSVVARYAHLDDAVAHAESGDTLRLAADIRENGTLAIGLDDLTLDLGGHVCALRAAAKGTAGADGSGGAIAYTGKGTLAIASPARSTLMIELGSTVEQAGGAVYQGIAVSGGGTLSVASTCAVEVAYAGADASSAQRNVVLRGITVTNGRLALDGVVKATTAPAAGGRGALEAAAVYAEAARGAHAVVGQSASSSIVVEGLTAAYTTDNSTYAESSTSGYTNPSVRRIYPGPGTGLYDAIQAQFMVSAQYDPRENYTQGSQFGVGVYYTAGPMTLSAPGAWYDGLRVWAYSDVVAEEEVGKLSSIKAAYTYVQVPYDTVPRVYGIQSGAASAGSVEVDVKGSVSVSNGEGDAYALKADGAASTVWRSAKASLSASGDASVHSVEAGALDLRDVMAFSPEVGKKVMYTGAWGSAPVLTEFRACVARCASVADGVSFTVSGATTLAVSGGDAADVEASRIKADGSFRKTNGSCTVVGPSGQNEAGAVFVQPLSGSLSASLFSDATLRYDVAAASGGALAWAAAPNDGVVSFMLGEAVVKRYRGAGSVSLSEPSALAQRAPDGRQHYNLTGWSTKPDDYGPPTYAPDAVVRASGDATYYATYSQALNDGMRVEVGGAYDGEGSLLPAVSVRASYGQTLGAALAAAGAELPAAQDYADAAGTAYRFVGWSVDLSASGGSSQQWQPGALADGLVLDSQIAGVTSGSVTVRAVYVPVRAGQHLVVFKVDGQQFACAVGDGQSPYFRLANSASSTSMAPSKLSPSVGVSYAFENWVDEADGSRYGLVLPAATRDAVYSASFKEAPVTVGFTFYVLQRDIGSATTYSRRATVVEADYSQSAQSVADSVVKIGDRASIGGKVYTFAGWALRETDTEPYYTADRPLAQDNWDSSAISSTTYSKTYYGIYHEAAHRVTVAFYNGSDELGRATVLSTATVNDAFIATNAQYPGTSGKAGGWSTSPLSSVYVDAISTTIGSLVEGAADSLSLYFVEGGTLGYTVRFHDVEGKVMATVVVGSGNTVSAVLKANDRSLDAPSKEGCYFYGWRMANGDDFSLDAPVTGIVDAYPVHKGIAVDMAGVPDASGVSCVATSTHKDLEGAADVTLVIARHLSADTPLRSFMSLNGYSLLESYSIQLVATNANGVTRTVTGDIGEINLRFYVGTQYADSSVRVFWIGGDGGITYSTVRDIDAEGFITVTVTHYQLGDFNEGGNLAIGYLEGGALAPSGSFGADGGLDTGKLSLDSSTLKLSALSLMSNMAAVSSALSDGALLADKGKSADGALEGEDGADGDRASWLFDGWGSDAVVFALLCVALAALAVRGIWKALTARPKRGDDDEDAVFARPQLAGNIRF